MSAILVLRFLSVVSVILSVPAVASQIGSSVPGKKSWDLHETFTAIARTCVDGARPRVPTNCSGLFNQVRDRMRQRQNRSNVEAYSARWPDDPTRMLEGAPSMLRFGLHFLNHCESPLRRGPAIDRVGLLCSSHFGRLQFFHAQASAEDRNDPAVTRSKILAWAMFAYQAATVAEFRQSDYCRTVEQLPNANLKRALTFSDRVFCTDRPSYPHWQVGTLFALRCSSLFTEQVCQLGSRDQADAVARQGARGAVLHLIQDSFSQSHVARVPDSEAVPGPRGPFVARVVCRSPIIFYDYMIQNLPTPDDNGEMREDPHARADAPPVLDSSCSVSPRSTDDVLTASAVALYYLDNPDPAQFRTYLETRVFPVGS